MNRVLNRVFLWHKDTDPFRDDERMQSAAYYQDLKLLTTGSRGCVNRLFDLKHDPLEAHNLIRADAARDCSVNFDHRSVLAVEKMLDNELISAHCESRVKHNHNHNHNVNVHSVSKTTQHSGDKGLNGEAADLTGSKHCVSKYVQHVMDRVAHMFPRLAAFAKHGSAPHGRYMRNDLHNATCRVPFASDIKIIDFEVPPDCASKFECSVPEY